MGIFNRPAFSEWRIAGSAGVGVQVETPVVNLSVGGAYLQLPLENTRTKQTITLHMAGAGVGLGVGISAFGIVDIEGSLSSFPSDGIGRLIKGPQAGRRLRRRDFEGNRVITMTLGGKAVAGGSIVAAAFISGGFWDRLKAAAIPGLADDIALWSHAGGLFYGAAVGSGASAGISLHEYQVITVV